MNILKHPRNKHISFDKEKHTYSYKGEKFNGVTKWIGSYCKPFDREGMSKVMAYKEGKTQEEILQLWSDLNEYGNEVHDIIEDWINLGTDSDREELTNTKIALEELELEPIKGEFVIYDEDIKRASPIDILAKNSDGKLVIVDTKTMFKPIRYFGYKNARMKPPLHHLPDSAYYKYCLQTNIYRKWLVEKYKADVADTSYILHIHQNMCDVVPCLTLEKEVGLMYGQ